MLASDVFSVNGPEIEAVTTESTSLGDAWVEHLPSGVRKASLSQDGFYDDATAGVNEAFTGANQTEQVFCVALNAEAIGNKFIGVKGVFGAKTTRVSTRADLHRMNIDYTVTGAVDEGIILLNQVAKTSDGNTEGADSVDNAASSANGGAGYLQVTAYSGLTNVIYKIRHSVDDVTYADLITFATVTAAPTAERLTVSGTVNRHLAVDWNVTGSGSVTAMVGFARNP